MASSWFFLILCSVSYSFQLQMPPQILWFPLLCHCRIVRVISYPLRHYPAILFPVVPLGQAYILLTERARIPVRQSYIMFGHSMYQRSIHFPCNQVVVYLSVPSETSLRFSEYRFFISGVRSSPPRQTPNLEGQGVPFFLGHHLLHFRLG